ncbi:MAG: LysR family transcriptional regulator [Pseudomonadota bacterium]
MIDKAGSLRLDGRSLKLFVAIYDLGSVNAAADKFDINQSTASHHLDKLRKVLGDALFTKVGRTIVPTDFAHSIAPRAREIVAKLEGLVEIDGFSPEQEIGPIVVAANASELTPELVRLRTAISMSAPQAEINFVELGSRDNILPLLKEANAEIAISVRSEAYSAELNYSPFFSDSIICFYDEARRGSVDSLSDYTEGTHAVVDFGGRGLSVVSAFLKEHSIHRDIQLKAQNAIILGQLAAGSHYIISMQSRLRLSAFKYLNYCASPIEFPPVHYDVIWHKRSEDSPRNIWLRNLALSVVPVEEAAAS